MPAKKALMKDGAAVKPAAKRGKSSTAVKQSAAAEMGQPVSKTAGTDSAAVEVVLVEKPSLADFGNETGMIAPGGVEVIGLLALVTLIYSTGLLYLLW